MKIARIPLFCCLLATVTTFPVNSMVCKPKTSLGVSSKTLLIGKKCNFGDTKIVQGGLAFLSTDWIITSKYNNSSSVATCLNGAPNHAAMWAFIGTSLKHENWVYIQGSGSTSRYIMYVGGDTYYSSPIQVMKSSPMPSGWVVIREVSRDYKVIQSTNKAPAKTQIWVTFSSPVPSGWVVIKNQPGYKLIQKSGQGNACNGMAR